jgi:alpha-glucosidase
METASATSVASFSRLSYLDDLDVDAVWLSPVTVSPLRDGGYDISDFINIEPKFGDFETFERLTKELHRRHIRMIVDFVPNHTAIEHLWFTESRSSRDNPKRDWYIWREPAPDGGPPNNWACCRAMRCRTGPLAATIRSGCRNG